MEHRTEEGDPLLKLRFSIVTHPIHWYYITLSDRQIGLTRICYLEKSRFAPMSQANVTGKLSTGVVKFFNDGVVEAVTFAYWSSFLFSSSVVVVPSRDSSVSTCRVICSGALLFSSRVLRPSLVTLCSQKSSRCAAELYHAPHLWYPPFYTSPMASSALQH